MNFIGRALAANSDVNAENLQLQLAEGANDIGDLISRVLPWVSIAAGVIAFAYLLYSGFIYLTAGGNAEAAKKGQTGILHAIIGLIIIALAYTITTAVIGTVSNTDSL